MNFAESISKLPKVEAFNPACDLYMYKGIWLPSSYLETTLILHEQFQAQPFNIFLCSFIKTGTTWLKSLVFAITTRHLFDDKTTPLLTSLPHDCLPLMEIDFAKDQIFTSRNNNPLLATHLPYNLLPKSIIESGSKIVYICREPKDTFTSFWHMVNKIQHTSLSCEDRNVISMEEQFEYFCDGKVAYGSYWDHVLGFWKAKNEKPEEILFLKYEDMKKDPVYYVKKLAEFMDKPFSLDEIKNNVPEKIVRLCSFEKLSNLEVNKTGSYGFVDNKLFFRKGETGDWKNLLTENMGKKMDMITYQKMENTGFTFMLK